MKAQTVTSTKPSDSRKSATAYALKQYFNQAVEDFLKTPPLRRIEPEKLRNDILFTVLTETYDVVHSLLGDKKVFNSVFKQTFRPLIQKAWAEYPKR